MLKVLRFAPVLAALALASCVEDKMDEGGVTPDNSQAVASHLTTVHLTSFAGNAGRVSYAEGTRADEAAAPGTLQLVAKVSNPSKAEGFNFVKEEGGRWLSATSVYYNETTQTYYATYHMQGNNYNTTVENEIGGAVQVFKVSDEGEVTLGDGFRAANPNSEDYDFNHLYFDNTDQRIVAVGHKWNVPSSWTGEGDYTGKRDNTRAIIGEFDPVQGTFTYATIDTAEKAYDAEGKSLGYTDAGDANCVIRGMDGTPSKDGYAGYPNYYVATRKGIAVLSAKAEDLFAPALNEDGSNYFVPTPGSVKYVYDTPRTGSMMDFLYLSEESGEGESYDKSSKANIAQFQLTSGITGAYVLMNPASPFVTYYDSKDLDILNYEKQFEVPAVVSPIDGKNTICVIEDYEYYAALGTTGLYYKYKGALSSKEYEGVLKFGNRPVNCVVVDTPEYENGHDGFIYVANGSKLTILHRRTLQEVASWNMPAKDEDGNDVASSANYITVRKAPRVGESFEPRERIITVAFGQEGLRIFKFTPETKTVWE